MKTKKIIYWLIGVFILLPVVLACVTTFLLYQNQEKVTQQFIGTLNEDFHGKFTLEGSHIDVFAAFPYISVDLEGLRFFETKNTDEKPVFHFRDTYVGFDVWSIIQGDFEIKSISLDSGELFIVQDTAGRMNLLKGLEPTKEIESAEEEFNLYLKEIHLKNIDILKLNQSDSMLAEVFIHEAHSKYKTSAEYTKADIDTRFEFNLIEKGDTTFFKHKNFALNSSMHIDGETNLITIEPSEVRFESGIFGLEGTVDPDDDMFLDLEIKGNKPNFDLLLAFAPEEVVPILENYNNKGEVYFSATAKGKSINGHSPALDAEFGAADAFFRNLRSDKALHDMSFKGYFTNGEKRDITTMEFSLMDFSAKPEEGVFSGHLTVKNFESPEIDTRIHADFNLEFLAGFLELEDLSDLRGKVKMTMNFHDIIDVANPEKTLENLNEAYYTELNVENLGFTTPDFHVPFSDINIKASMDGHRAEIEHFSMIAGKSDIKIKGSVSDLPAIIHHLDKKVRADIEFQADRLDIKELTSNDTLESKPIDEVFEDFSMKLAFESTAKELSEFEHLPRGEFFIDKLNGKFKNYPHALHDFYADIYIEENDFRIADFRGMVDESDFEFTGGLHNYKMWFDSIPSGDTKIDVDLKSGKLQLKDLFAYDGENYVPEEYRDEVFKELNVKMHADLHYDTVMHSADVYLDRLYGFMHVHPLKLRSFSGRVHLEKEHFKVYDLSGKIGNSDFTVNLDFLTGDGDRKQGVNYAHFKSNRLDFDELMNYKPAGSDEEVDHDDVFNIYELPFPDMTVKADIGRLNYHNYLIDDFYSELRTTKDHYVYIDTMGLHVADGKLMIKGYFNGSDPDEIYFSPDMRMERIDIDKVMVKFDNFGQDAVVSDNLHGRISGKITGNVRMHADMVPIIDQSELHIDLLVTEGRLDNYGPMELMAEYFTDKNLMKVKFDTLANHIDVENGVMKIPSMTINSTLGYIEMSGSQELDGEMEYFVRVPLKMIKQAGVNKLFRRRKDVDEDQEDEIIKRDESKRTRFLNLRIHGTPEKFEISTGRDKNAES